MNIRLTPALGLLLAVTVISVIAAPVNADEFYANKRITLMIGSAPGGGYDTLGRAVTRWWGKHIPGNPHFVVQNMPGASSLNMTNHVYSVAARDGTVIGLANNAMPTAPILYPKAARFDPAKLSWIGGPSRDAMVVMVWHTAPAQTIEDLFKKEILVGGAARGSAPVDYPLVADEVLGTKFKLITGYRGNEDVDLAMERGEIHGNAGLGWVSAKNGNAEWLASGKAKIIAQYGFRAHPDLPNVPVFPAPAKAADRQVLEILYARDESGRPFFGPPEIPKAQLTTLRHSFEAMLKDEGFLADAQKINLVIDPVTGEQLEELAQRLAQTPPEVAERARKILNN
jgi:tripartite-type tricarboxylate transporter receptor subunit TctC